MKRHYFNSLREFYADTANTVGSENYREKEAYDRASWVGLSRASALENKFSYPVGVEKLNKFADFAVTKDERVKYWSSDDGFEIDIDRMLEDMDFLLSTRKIRKLPKTADIYINVSENCDVGYQAMLCKSYAAIKIADKLETLGVRCAIYACAAIAIRTMDGNIGDTIYVEVAVKQHADTLNLGALCTAISPWMLRRWMFLFITGHYFDVGRSIGSAIRLPSDIKGIVIDHGMCLDQITANKFIESIKM